MSTPLGDDVCSAALAWRQAGHPVALATVLRTWGSSPRRPGSQLAVNDRRDFVGSVSGGCVEGAVIEAALEVMQSRAPRTLEFGVSDAEAWAVGLACGGRVAILVEPVDAEAEALLGQLVADRERRRGAVVATWLVGGAHALIHPLDGPPDSAPDTADGPAEVSGALRQAAHEALLADRSALLDTPEGEVFLRVQNPPLRMVVVGAVHIAQALAPMAALAGFEVTVVDPRSAFATDARFPGVRLERGWPEDALSGFGIDHRTAVVTLSHDPKLDDPALAAALASPAFYVGALGSRRTHAKRLARLEERGFTEAERARIAAPVGLDIGALTPAEIAVATLAQVVERLRAGAQSGAVVGTDTAGAPAGKEVA